MLPLAEFRSTEQMGEEGKLGSHTWGEGAVSAGDKRTVLSIHCWASGSCVLQVPVMNRRARGVWYWTEPSCSRQELVQRLPLPTGHDGWLVDNQPRSRCPRPRGNQAVSVRPAFQTLGTLTLLQLWALINRGWGTSRLFQSERMPDALSWVTARKHKFTDGMQAADSLPSRIRTLCFLLSVAQSICLVKVVHVMLWKTWTNFLVNPVLSKGFLGGWVINNLPANAGDTRGMGSIPGWGRSLGVVNGNPLQYSCLENPMDRGAW